MADRARNGAGALMNPRIRDWLTVFSRSVGEPDARLGVLARTSAAQRDPDRRHRLGRVDLRVLFQEQERGGEVAGRLTFYDSLRIQDMP